MNLTLPLDPVPAPRQVRSDAWNPRPGVVRYRAFRDAVAMLTAGKLESVPEHGLRLTFAVPMPPSWSGAKRDRMRGTPHRQRPDVDNLAKALLDSLWPDGDAEVWHLTAIKRWADKGSITIEEAG